MALYSVGSRKTVPGVRTYVSVDGGMADNIRPALYGARYAAALANRSPVGEPLETVTIAGKYCESGDVLIDNASLPELDAGDLGCANGRRLLSRHGKQLQSLSPTRRSDRC